MGMIKMLLEDYNNQLLDTICNKLTTIDDTLKGRLLPSNKSRELMTVNLDNKISVRGFIKEKRYVILSLNITTNKLFLYKGIKKVENELWSPTHIHKTLYDIESFDNDDIIEILAKEISKQLEEPIIEYYVPENNDK